MSRPSGHVDELLIKAGMELISEKGISGLSIRQVALKAGVNQGMFHYHFKTKEEFARRVLASGYGKFLGELTRAESKDGGDPLQELEKGWNVFGRFVRDHRKLAMALLQDSSQGYKPCVTFLSGSIPPHVEILSARVLRCQKAGMLKKMPLPAALFFLGGSVVGPLALWTMLEKVCTSGKNQHLEAFILPDSAIGQRVRLGLRGMATPTGLKKLPL